MTMMVWPALAFLAGLAAGIRLGRRLGFRAGVAAAERFYPPVHIGTAP